MFFTVNGLFVCTEEVINVLHSFAMWLIRTNMVEPICHRDIQVELRIEFIILIFLVTSTVVLHGLLTSAIVACVPQVHYICAGIYIGNTASSCNVHHWPLPFLSPHSSLWALKILVSG